jgi:SEC-C motif-containing protein
MGGQSLILNVAAGFSSARNRKRRPQGLQYRNMKQSAASCCPCGGANYAGCCQPYHDGSAAPDAARLMRARYSAYALGRMQFVFDTWHATTRPLREELAHDPAIKWLGLEVRQHVPGEDVATVEFVARSKSGGRAQRLHEISRFVREDGRWFYVDGTFPE